MKDKAGFLTTLWKRAMLRKIHFANAHSRFDLLYKLPDPWGMETAREQHRFCETNAFLRQHVGSVETLLEIGCGEGHQTIALQKAARTVVAVDVSPSAIRRARARAPGVTFVVGDILESPEFATPRRFDVVTACELLYYVKDVPAYVRALERLGRHVLATYFDKHKDALEPIVTSRPGVVTGNIQFEETVWTIATWPGDSDVDSRPPQAR
jgi:SAM-dependent methyltransferase